MFPEVGGKDAVVIRETYGSIGAPLLMEAVPESRMILLLRDPRDVLASSLDAFRRGSWGSTALGADNIPDFDMEDWADLYMRTIGNARHAYESHSGRKALLRYEDLRSDPIGMLKKVYSALHMPVEEKQLAEAAKKHSWEAVPEGAKGPGRFYRKATPGGWKVDLTAAQVAIVERVAAPVLEEFYS